MWRLALPLLLIGMLLRADKAIEVSAVTAAQVAQYRALRDGDPRAATTWLTEIVAGNPAPALLFLLANDRADAGDVDAALATLDRLLSVAPAFPGARRNRAILLARAGRCQDAVDELLAVCEGQGRDAELMLVLGGCYDRLGQPGAAETAYRWAQLHAPGEAPVHLRLAHSLYAQGLFAAAERAAAAAIDRGAVGDDAWRLRAAALVRLDQAATAITVLETARTVLHEFPADLRTQLIRLYLRAGLAAPAADLLLAGPEPDRDLLTDALRLALHRGDDETARRAADALLAAPTAGAAACYYAALAAERAGAPERARERLRRALAAQANFVAARLELARLCIQAGDDAAALAELHAAANLPDGESRSLELELILRWRQGQWEDARKLARELARREPLGDWERVVTRLEELTRAP